MNTNISFSVSASGYLPLTYQWQSGSTMLSDNTRITGSSIVGNYSSSLIINNVQLSDTGSYRVFVSNIVGGVTSSYAQLYITYSIYPPVIVIHPIDFRAYISNTASFNVTALGTPILTYQWISGSTNLADGVRITGSNSASLRINNIQWTDTGSYKVFVSNPYGSVYSNEAILIVSENVIIKSMSDSASVTVGVTVGSHVSSPIVELGTSTTSGILSGDYILTIIPSTGSNDSASVDMGFYSGSLFDVVNLITGSNDSASVDMGFYTGSIATVVIESISSEVINSITVGLYTGSYV